MIVKGSERCSQGGSREVEGIKGVRRWLTRYTGCQAMSGLSGSSLFLSGQRVAFKLLPSLLLEEIGTRGGKRVELAGEGSGQTREGAREVDTSLYTQKM